MINIFKFHKQAFSIVLLSLLFIGCSSKSKKSNVGTNPSAIDENGTSALNGNENNQDANETSGLENEPHVCTNDENRVISRAYTDENGDGVIDTVKIYKYDENGILTSIDMYEDVNGEKEPENNGIDLKGTVLYTYNADGTLFGRTIQDKDGNVVPSEMTHSYNSNVDSISKMNDDGTKTIIKKNDTTGDGIADTAYIFNYDENGILRTGKSEYPNGRTKEYTYGYDANGNRIKEVITHKDENGNIVDTETIFYDDMGNVLQSSHDTNGNGEADSSNNTEYEYTCI